MEEDKTGNPQDFIDYPKHWDVLASYFDNKLGVGNHEFGVADAKEFKEQDIENDDVHTDPTVSLHTFLKYFF